MLVAHADKRRGCSDGQCVVADVVQAALLRCISAARDGGGNPTVTWPPPLVVALRGRAAFDAAVGQARSLIPISEPTRQAAISHAAA